MEINQPYVDISIGSANFATKRGFPHGGRGCRFHYSHSSGRGFPTNTSYGRNFWGRRRGRGPSNSFNTAKPICQICHKPGHEASDCYRRFDTSPYDSTTFMQPQAHYASQQAPPDQAWYSDSGATHHLTPDLNNLTFNAAEICVVIKSIHPVHPQLWLENACLLVLGTHTLATQLYISVLESYPNLNYLFSKIMLL